MAGRNFLFVPGPTNVPERLQRAMMVSMEDHRSPNFPHLTHTRADAALNFFHGDAIGFFDVTTKLADDGQPFLRHAA